MLLTIITKGSSLNNGRGHDSTSDIPDKEMLLKFSKYYEVF